MSNLQTTFSGGDLRLSLEALRDHLAATLIDSPPQSAAAIANQLRQVVKDIAALGSSEEEGSVVDEIAKRRAARVAGPDATDGAAEQGGKQRRGRSRSS